MNVNHNAARGYPEGLIKSKSLSPKGLATFSFSAQSVNLIRITTANDSTLNCTYCANCGPEYSLSKLTTKVLPRIS